MQISFFYNLMQIRWITHNFTPRSIWQLTTAVNRNLICSCKKGRNIPIGRHECSIWTWAASKINLMNWNSWMIRWSRKLFFLSEKKIDISYPNSQFTLTGYNMYRKDREKRGGGMVAYFDSSLPSKDLKITKRYKTLEILAVEASLGNNEVIFLGIYRP